MYKAFLTAFMYIIKFPYRYKAYGHVLLVASLVSAYTKYTFITILTILLTTVVRRIANFHNRHLLFDLCSLFTPTTYFLYVDTLCKQQAEITFRPGSVLYQTVFTWILN